MNRVVALATLLSLGAGACIGIGPGKKETAYVANGMFLSVSAAAIIAVEQKSDDESHNAGRPTFRKVVSAPAAVIFAVALAAVVATHLINRNNAPSTSSPTARTVGDRAAALAQCSDSVWPLSASAPLSL